MKKGGTDLQLSLNKVFIFTGSNSKYTNRGLRFTICLQRVMVVGLNPYTVNINKTRFYGKILNSIFCFILIFGFSLVTKGQVVVSDSISEVDTLSNTEYSFINYDADTLIRGNLLTPFFNKLLKLEDGDTNQMNILHIGDSHIQADFLTREVRKNLQQRFGNAGRGLVFPLRVAGTNEPADYRSSSNVGWQVARINSQANFPDPGISSISMRSDEAGAYFDFTTFNHDDLDYSFDEVTLIHTKDSLQYDCRFTDSPLKFGFLMSARPIEPDENTTLVKFPKPSNYLRIQAEQTEAGQNSCIVNGVILKKSQPGVFYHSVGINGAHFSDYNRNPLFFNQLKVIKPDLVIISLGTNEGANIKIAEEEMIASATAMIQAIRNFDPKTCILIATPADDYFRKKYKNPYLELVQRALLKTATLENTACWDFYTISGGYGSCTEWRKAALLQRDGVHYNKQGYALQGELLYKALINSYLKYAAD
jgi:lysophospholipase L1-like esterase